jgi:hypothetical protein
MSLIAIALLPPSPDWWDARHRRMADRPTRLDLVNRTVRRAEARIRLLEMRDSAAPLLARRTAEHTGIPTLVLSAAISPRHRQALAAAWDSIIAELGPAAMGSGVAIRVLAGDAPPDATLYLLPEATGGGGCVVVVELGRWRRTAHLPRILRRALGPCAYYHAFGSPGPHLRAWLGRSAFHPAQETDWEGTPRESESWRRPDPLVSEGRDLERVIEAVWQGPYLETPAQTACAAGRLASCARVLDAPEGPYYRQRRWPDLEARGGFVRQGPLAYWWAPEPGYFFADLVRTQGRERFARFWQSSLPVDSAFAATFGVPLDRYVSEWLRGDRTIRLGSSIRTSSVLLSLLFVALVVAGGAVLTTRRRVP